ncbi:MAG: DUF308 domain-containing protein [Sphingopyxis sp.]|uniref:HdeD family acid-resistance protein n=1 Tax=Sphingopyxis sp. TaxID=1908224 RepID=UPI002ABD0FF3|nr:DUF308 domain-containing protein [Sphingopyxis sp.]MDZ3833037.1 DUF308 domain-containing protein [Sphingopyxis sp.]
MKNWLFWLIAGILALVGGFFALANPFGASLAVNFLAGWTFLMIGALQCVAVFRTEGLGSKLWAGLVAILAIWTGISLFSHPLAGLLSLTLMLAVIFMVEGIAKIFMSFPLRRLGGSTALWVLLSGVVSIILSVMIFSDFPQSAAVMLGILLAVELISTGASLIAVGLAFKKEGSAATD